MRRVQCQRSCSLPARRVSEKSSSIYDQDEDSFVILSSKYNPNKEAKQRETFTSWTVIDPSSGAKHQHYQVCV